MVEHPAGVLIKMLLVLSSGSVPSGSGTMRAGSPDGLIAPGEVEEIAQTTTMFSAHRVAMTPSIPVTCSSRGRTERVASMLLEIDGRKIETSELPSLTELGVTAGTLEAAEEIAGRSDVAGLERHALELLVRAVVFADRLAHLPSTPRPE